METYTQTTSFDLLCNLRDTAIDLGNKHQEILIDCLEALRIEQSFFRPVLGRFSGFKPTRKELEIIRNADRFSTNHLEGAFFKYGELPAFVALILVFRETELLRNRWATLPSDFARQWLVSNIAELLINQKNNWITEYLRQGKGTTPFF